jgi:hypothetical protein
MDLYKIKKKLDSISKVGTDNFLEYYKYIDELINKVDKFNYKIVSKKTDEERKRLSDIFK